MKSKYKKIISLVLFIAIIMMTGCSEVMIDDVTETNKTATNDKNELKVHFIDVGQADSILIQFPDGKVSLIDAGNRDDKQTIINYIDNLNIKKIDYLILTHPHEDHIGSAPDVIAKYDIGKIYMPDAVATTKIFENTMLNIKKKNIKTEKVQGGINICKTNKYTYDILAPNSKEYDETNEYSVVTKLTYGDNSFLFTGDAEKISEDEMMKKGYDLSADVLKVGHHGGRTSTSAEFLKKVNPTCAVIMSEKGNDYGHPHKEVLDRLNKQKVEIYRIDKMGTIVAVSDGKTIEINNQKISSNATVKETVKKEETKPIKEVKEKYIGNKNSKTYHKITCSGLPETKNQVEFKSKKEAESNGYKPCSKCKP